MNVLFKKFLSLLGCAAVAAVVSFGISYFQQPQQPIMKVGAAPQFTAAKPTTLYGSGISSSDTSITLTSLVTPDGTPITTSQLVGGIGNVFYITVEPASTRKETISCTAVTQNTIGTALLTGCIRGLQFTYPYTVSASLATQHSGGSAVVLSNSPQMYNDIITYVNSAMAAGTVDASPTAKGVVEIASILEASNHAQNGSGNTSAYLALTSNLSSSTRTAGTSQVVVSSSTDGYIDHGYINSNGLLPGVSVTSASTTFATSTLNIGAFNAYQIGKNVFATTSTGTSTFAVPSGITKLFVILVGGGAAGGGSNSALYSGASGSAGGCARGMVDVTGTSSIQFAIGVGGPANGASTGANGGNSFFGPSNNAFLTANGGKGGPAASAGGQVSDNGGTASGGFLNTQGGSGQGGIGGSTAFVPGLGIGGASCLGSTPAPGTGGSGAAQSSSVAGIAGALIVIW